MIPERSLGVCVAYAVAALFAGTAVAQAGAACTPYELRVSRQIKQGKAFLKDEKFRKWIDVGLSTTAPYNKGVYKTYRAWYDRFDGLGTLKAKSETLKFYDKHGFTASAAYSVIEKYALDGKLKSSVDIGFEQKMNAFDCP